mgnify:CR=1 FL=1
MIATALLAFAVAALVLAGMFLHFTWDDAGGLGGGNGVATFGVLLGTLSAYFPRLGMVLMRDFHLGGCRNCGFNPHDSIETVATQNGIPTARVDEMLALVGLEDVAEDGRRLGRPFVKLVGARLDPRRTGPGSTGRPGEACGGSVRRFSAAAPRRRAQAHDLTDFFLLRRH